MTEPRPVTVIFLSLVCDAIFRLLNGDESLTELNTDFLCYSQYLSSKKSSKIIDVLLCGNLMICFRCFLRKPISFVEETTQLWCDEYDGF
jgi:hypothetical protein